MRVAIVEDEYLAQEELERLIKSHFPILEVAVKLTRVSDAVEWFRSNTVDLVFMDIQLADNISFEIFNQVRVSAPVIFTTAFDQYAIKAFETNSIGYLLKPIDEVSFVKAVTKFESLRGVNQELLRLLSTQMSLSAQPQYKDRIMAKLGDNYAFIPVEEVSYFFAEDHYTFVVTASNKKMIVNYTLEMLDSMLNPRYFMRITRNCIANIKSIGLVSKYFGSRLKVKLNPDFPSELLISRQRVNDFLSWLDGM